MHRVVGMDVDATLAYHVKPLRTPPPHGRCHDGRRVGRYQRNAVRTDRLQLGDQCCGSRDHRGAKYRLRLRDGPFLDGSVK